jgi:uncharacterized protein (TIGR00730 family)
MMDYDNLLDFLDGALTHERGVDPAISELSPRDMAWLRRVREEFIAGFRIMAGRGPCATVFGSARIARDSVWYELARKVGQELARAGLTVVTGGGPGAMEAAGRGAIEAGGVSVGLGIKMVDVEPPNPYLTDSVNFRYFFVRKVMLVKYATAFVLLPGGVGTLDELFETLNLIQTKKIAPFPVILVGSEFWAGQVAWMREQLLQHGLVSPETLDLFLLEDDPVAVAENITRWTATHDPAALKRPALERPPKLSA